MGTSYHEDAGIMNPQNITVHIFNYHFSGTKEENLSNLVGTCVAETPAMAEIASALCIYIFDFRPPSQGRLQR